MEGERTVKKKQRQIRPVENRLKSAGNWKGQVKSEFD
jgi:hypothetical protein